MRGIKLKILIHLAKGGQQSIKDILIDLNPDITCETWDKRYNVFMVSLHKLRRIVRPWGIHIIAVRHYLHIPDDELEIAKDLLFRLSKQGREGLKKHEAKL